jgi:hypothetical protein
MSTTGLDDTAEDAAVEGHDLDQPGTTSQRVR